MKCEELMIGNQVIIGKGTDLQEYVVIDEILNGSVSLQGREFTTFIGSLDPIPITEELLAKNGFIKRLLIESNEAYDDWVEFYKEVDGYHLSIRHCSNTIERDWYVHIDNEYRCSVGRMDIEFVHQLQNTMNILGVKLHLKL